MSGLVGAPAYNQEGVGGAVCPSRLIAKSATDVSYSLRLRWNNYGYNVIIVGKHIYIVFLSSMVEMDTNCIAPELTELLEKNYVFISGICCFQG